jgi:hypothetical protein
MLRRRVRQFIADVRPGPKMLLVISLSFCLGLLVFYVPERKYAGVPTIWLPPTGRSDDGMVDALPVKTDPYWRQGVRFMPYVPGGVELVEANAQTAKLDAAICPDLYDVSEQTPGPCMKIGTVGSAMVYGIQRQKDSYNIQAYAVRDGTFIAITGVYSYEEAVQYIRQLAVVPHRGVNSYLSDNLAAAQRSVAALQTERERQVQLELTAYQRLPFAPLLPATMPAGWVQYALRIGTDAAHPTSVDILYKKGDRSIGMSLVPRVGFSLGKKCGPTPGHTKFIACRKEKNRIYYEGGVNTPHRTTLYLYRPLGNTIAIVHMLARGDEGKSMVFDEDTMRAQASIIGSLRVVDKERLRGAGFTGTASDPLADIPSAILNQ